MTCDRVSGQEVRGRSGVKCQGSAGDQWQGARAEKTNVRCWNSLGVSEMFESNDI